MLGRKKKQEEQASTETDYDKPQTLAELDEMKLQWVAIGHAEARAALDGGARPERFMAIFGR